LSENYEQESFTSLKERDISYLQETREFDVFAADH